jgi:hypothetical protein
MNDESYYIIIIYYGVILRIDATDRCDNTEMLKNSRKKKLAAVASTRTYEIFESLGRKELKNALL